LIPHLPSCQNSSHAGHTGTNMGTNVASFPRTNMSRKEKTGKLSIFANFGREYFDTMKGMVALGDTCITGETTFTNHICASCWYTNTVILVDLGDFGQIPGPSSVLFGGCCCCVFVSLLFSAHLINCVQLIN
jgi:hypothetical protein